MLLIILHAMKINSKYFDNIRIKGKAEPKKQLCDWSGCKEEGTHPAPASRASKGKKLLLCLKHVRDYNRNYNFFEDMNESEFLEYQKASRLGMRPTWNMATAKQKTGNKKRFSDPLELMQNGKVNTERKKNAPRLSPAEKSAFEELGLGFQANKQEVRQRYKVLVKRYHPDTNGGDRSWEEKLTRVIKAHTVLKSSGFC